MARDPMIVRMPFGKYKGKRLRDIPVDYLLFLRDKFGGLHEFADLAWAVPIVVNEFTIGTHGDQPMTEAVADMLLSGKINADDAREMLGEAGTAEPESIRDYLKRV